VGRSGSGKTTLLNMLSGWEVPDSGEIKWCDGAAGEPLAWTNVSVVPQKLGLIDEFTVRKNIEYPARLARLLEDTRELADRLIHQLGLEELGDRLPSETSIGEQQRTALARALLLAPNVVLADEPSGHQDRTWAKGVFDALHEAAERGTCCLVATHSEEAAESLDEVFTMEDGRIIE
jgi:putative ABC transport system ATP-binding protein